jgi:membrane fusion protein (multidrug efflux system)
MSDHESFHGEPTPPLSRTGFPRPRRGLRWIVMVVGVVLLVGAIFAGKVKLVMDSMASQSPPPPPTVTTLKVGLEEWNNQIESVGTLRSVLGVELASEVAGVVRTVRFRSGDAVEAGAVLVELNADAERAQLQSLEAAAALSRINLGRDREQFAAGIVTQAMIDNDETDLRSRTALVDQQKALIEKKIVRAPFAGRTGITTVNPGQYLNAGDRVVSLQSTDRLYADFSVPQREVSRLSAGARVEVRADAFPDRTFAGRVASVHSTVDAATRNLQLEALVPNPGRVLVPGMFVKVALIVGKPDRRITVPQAALSFNAYGTTLFVVEDAKDDKGAASGKARQVFVTTGATRGDQVAILTGLQGGEEVVTSGQLKLRAGSPLRVDNSHLPRNDPAPRPQEQ